jgi:hypothetical protein
MSAQCTGAVFERYPVGGGEMLLALALADSAYADGTNILVSIDTMATKSRQSVRAVQVHLRKMLARGWLQVDKRGGGRGRWTRYRISPEWLKGAELAPFLPDSGTPELSTKGADSAGFSDPERVQIHVQKGADLGTPYITELTQIPPTPPAGGVCSQSKKPGTPGFNAIAAGYPRRAGIDAAQRDWDELAPDARLQAEIARAIQAWIPSAEWQREKGRFIPKLGKFLRDQRWLDAPGLAAPSSAPPLPVDPPLTPEQLETNGRRAREYVGKARALIATRQAVPA